MLEAIIFGTFAGLLFFSSIMVVFSQQTMHSILWLVLSFLSAAALWVLLTAEFLGLLLILVYVGAILTLFLFVIMTISTNPIPVLSQWKSKSHYMISVIITLLGLGCIIYGLHNQIALPSHNLMTSAMISEQPLPQSNTHALGVLLYSDFIYPFELVSVLLLVAIIVSISLHTKPHQTNDSKKSSQSDSIQIRRKDRITLVKGD